MRAARVTCSGAGFAAAALVGCFSGGFMLHEACRSDDDCVDYDCVDGYCGGPPAGSEPTGSAPPTGSEPTGGEPPAAGCGDGVVDPGEDCDGPVDDPAARCVACELVGCPLGYHLVPEAFCAAGLADPAECRRTCVADTCGDGLVTSYEDCDDGNADESDACLSTCAAAECGDGFVHAGAELCDDGNTDNGDDCDQRCTLPTCGDGDLDAGEECDDGNVLDGDACRNLCLDARCGDGVVAEGEACDDANADESDGCLVDCSAAACGDGVLQTGLEACDDGNAADDDACVAGCVPASCGDGFVQAGVELCDAAIADPPCSADCVPASCGDGKVQAPEQCDDGDADETDECISDCAAASCGDGHVWAGEETCDLGVVNAAIGCVDGCAALTPVVDLAAGGAHTCAIVEGGELRCWGRNAECQLGLGDAAPVGDDEHPGQAPALDLGARTVLAVAPGGGHTCALFDDLEVRCWGSPAGFGYGDSLPRGCLPATVPAQLPPVSLWEGDEHTVRLVSGNQHTCALSNQGRVRCWGSNFGGELGYPEPFWVGYAGGGVPSDYGPVDVGGEVAELRAGKHGTCAILTDGALRCWGTNYFGSLGYGDADAVGDDETPADAGDVPLGDAVASVALGATHTCAVLVDDSTWCWGSNLGGELGLGDFNIFGYPTPQLVPAAAPPAALALGAAFSCAIDEGGDVRCWGTGVEGQLANGTGEGFGLGPGETPGAAPTLDFGFPPAAQRLVAGDGHACALLGPGSVHCWGAGADGQTGRAQTANLGDDPQELPLIVPVLLFPP